MKIRPVWKNNATKFKIGDIVEVTAIRSKYYGCSGTILEQPFSGARFDYGVDLFNNGKTAGYDENELKLKGT